MSSNMTSQNISNVDPCYRCHPCPLSSTFAISSAACRFPPFLFRPHISPGIQLRLPRCQSWPVIALNYALRPLRPITNDHLNAQVGSFFVLRCSALFETLVADLNIGNKSSPIQLWLPTSARLAFSPQPCIID